MSTNGSVITRATRHHRHPAVIPGSLEDSAISVAGDHGHGVRGHGSTLARRYMRQILDLCHSRRDKPMPPWKRDTRRLDRWLQLSLHDEKTAFLTAFIDQASMIQANRPFRVVGSRSMVNRTLRMLHMSEGGEGFRRMLKMVALNYYCTNHGGTIYLHRSSPVRAVYLQDIDAWDWYTPPVIQMFATDSTLFAPNDDYIYPFSYNNEPWTRYDYIRMVSMPSTMIDTWNVGRCALYRCIQIAQMTSAIYDYIYDIVSPDTAKGIITIKGMSTEEFLSAMTGSEAVNEQDILKKDGFLPGDDAGDLIVLADKDNEIVVRFVTLGRIPEGFFLNDWVRWTLTAFATNLGFPLEEFIGMPANRLLGESGAEVEAGQSRASSKGQAEFTNILLESLQQLVIPDQVHFEFSERDPSQALGQIDTQSKKVEMLVSLFEATQTAVINRGDELGDTLLEARARGTHLMTSEEARRLGVEWEILPSWFTLSNRDVTATDLYEDTDQVRLRYLRQEYREKPAAYRMAANPKGEPVILYENRVDRDTGLVYESEMVLWDDDNQLSRPAAWAGAGDGKLGVLRSASTPTDWGPTKNRKAKPVRLEHATDSDHTDKITRLLRRRMLEASRQRNEGGLSEMKSFLQRDEQESITSNLYALGQLGAQAVYGRLSLQDTQKAAIAGGALSYAAKRTDVLLDKLEEKLAKPSGSIRPDNPWRKRSLDDDLKEAYEAAKLDADVLADQGATFEGCLEERVKSLARQVALSEATHAFACGQYVAAKVLGATRKRWSGECGMSHEGLNEKEVKLEEDFEEGVFWAGVECPGCMCEVTV